MIRARSDWLCDRVHVLSIRTCPLVLSVTSDIDARPARSHVRATPLVRAIAADPLRILRE